MSGVAEARGESLLMLLIRENIMDLKQTPEMHLQTAFDERTLQHWTVQRTPDRRSAKILSKTIQWSTPLGHH